MSTSDPQNSPAQGPDSLTMSAATVATRLNLSSATINNWAKASTMPAYQVGRSWILFRAEFEVWLANTSTERDDIAPLPTLQQMTADMPPLLRIAEVAQMLCVSTATIASLIKRQQLGSVDLGAVGRVPAGALRAYLAAARNSA